jgi:type VI secretion system secreted protein Hcp
VGPAGANGLNGLPGPVGSSSTTDAGGAQSAASNIFIRLRPASGPDIGPVAIDHVAFEATTSTSIGSASSGAGAGKVKFGALVLQKAIDPTSPVLFKALAAGEHFSQATVFVRVGRGVAQTDQREYRMSQVFVTRLAQDTTTTKADETVQLAFGAIQLVEFVLSPSGKSQGVIVGGWDQAKNTSFKPTTLLPAP